MVALNNYILKSIIINGTTLKDTQKYMLKSVQPSVYKILHVTIANKFCYMRKKFFGNVPYKKLAENIDASQHINSLSALHVEKKIAKTINSEDIIDRFSLQNKIIT